MYHTIYGRHSSVNGDQVEKYIDMHKLIIPIEQDVSNIPMIYICGVTAQEMRDHAPYILSALPKYKQMFDVMGSWSVAHFSSWQIPTMSINKEFECYSVGMGCMLPNVGLHTNKNLSSAQKEILLWQLKLGISMQQIQKLMRVVKVEEPDGAMSIMDRVIKPKIKAALTCPIPMCQSCQLSQARLRKP